MRLENGAWRRAVLELSGATPSARLAACAIAEFGWGTGRIYPGQGQLQHLTGMSRSGLRNAIAELEALGWLTRHPGSGRQTTSYTLCSPVDNALEGVPQGVTRKRAEGRLLTPRGSSGDPLGVTQGPQLEELLENSLEKDRAGAPPAKAGRSRCAEHPYDVVSARGCLGCLVEAAKEGRR